MFTPKSMDLMQLLNFFYFPKGALMAFWKTPPYSYHNVPICKTIQSNKAHGIIY